MQSDLHRNAVYTSFWEGAPIFSLLGFIWLHVHNELYVIYVVRQGGPQPIYTTEALTYLPRHKAPRLYIEAVARPTVLHIIFCMVSAQQEQTFLGNRDPEQNHLSELDAICIHQLPALRHWLKDRKGAIDTHRPLRDITMGFELDQ